MNKLLEESGQKHIKIIADGNVNLNTIPDMYNNGAREFVLGKSGLFYGDINKNFFKIVSLIKGMEKKS